MGGKITTVSYCTRSQERTKVPTLITLLGAKSYRVLKTALYPDSPVSKSYDELVKTLKLKYRPASSIIVERYKFWNLKQSAYKRVADYVAAIKDQAALCKFNNFLQEALRDRLVSGLHDIHIQKALLGHSSDITFEKACEKAISMETAETQSKVVQGSHTAEEQVKKIVKGEKKRNMDRSSKFLVWGKCKRCGKKHDSKTCPAADWKCFICYKKGHTNGMQSQKEHKGEIGRRFV